MLYELQWLQIDDLLKKARKGELEAKDHEVIRKLLSQNNINSDGKTVNPDKFKELAGSLPFKLTGTDD